MEQEVGAAEKREILSPVRRVSFDSPVMAAATKLNRQQIQAILDLHKYVSKDSFKAYVSELASKGSEHDQI